MKLAKVITINDSIEAIVKKTVDEGKHSFTLNFVGVKEDDSLMNTTLTMGYNSKSQRDNDFDLMNKEIALRFINALPSFNELI